MEVNLELLNINKEILELNKSFIEKGGDDNGESFNEYERLTELQEKRSSYPVMVQTFHLALQVSLNEENYGKSSYMRDRISKL